MQIKLGDWERYFPGGVSVMTYARIGQLIRRHGPLVTIKVKVGDTRTLRAALDKLDRR